MSRQRVAQDFRFRFLEFFIFILFYTSYDMIQHFIPVRLLLQLLRRPYYLIHLRVKCSIIIDFEHGVLIAWLF
jgi:hypothetical protein